MHRTPFLLFAVSLLAAAAASAQSTYALIGRFSRSLGPYLNVPLVGNAGCGDLTLMSGPGLLSPQSATPASHPRTRGANTLPTAPPPTMGAAMGIDLGCVRGVGPVMTTGAGVGGALTLPANVFAKPLPAAPYAI